MSASFQSTSSIFSLLSMILLWLYNIAINIQQNRSTKMRFQFCGNISCPQWFIAEIAVLTKITSIKMKLIFSQLIAHYLDNEDISTKAVKLLTGTGLDVYEINAVVSTLSFILKNSVVFHVTDTVLNKELIDLGLPKENVESITKAYKANRDKLLQKSLQKLPKISSSLQLEYSLHDFLGSYRIGSTQLMPHKFTQINLTYKDINQKTNNVDFTMTEDQVEGMIYELEEILVLTDKIQGNLK